MSISCNVKQAVHVSGGYKNGSNAICGFTSELSFTLDDIVAYNAFPNYQIVSAKVSCTTSGGLSYSKVIDPSKIIVRSHKKAETQYRPITDMFNLNIVGTWSCWVELTDSNGDKFSFNIGTITVESPTWEKEITVNQPPPAILPDNTGLVDYVKVYRWDEDNGDWSALYDTYYAPVEIIETDSASWTFRFVFNSSQVSRDVDKQLILQPDVKLELAYSHYSEKAKEWRKAFFSTSRNQNYSNGLYNEVFVSGVTNNPNYSSRVWWSAINDPLYFPDTNYSEVGSNDTAIVGLTKVGDYLAAIKQSKTTDTAIYLLYPTSFEEETTFAVKQGVQGVGALARYAFNILGSETLFLSPNGVMAIVPSEDEEHKVQNRSYFVDKALLAEPNISKAYSFVFNGMYYLSMGDGHCYVLDGNQRNSWGNDKTNLVYECYYLENVPAICFAKCDGKLLFTDGVNVCRFTDGFVDAYNGAEENVPVFARWSTMLDDDGSLHYYKTMQKKGNLVSILPLENQTPYLQVSVTQVEFEADKTKYFTYAYKKYIRCKEDSVYDAGETYYIENRNKTRVYVRKDGNERVEIERKFGLSSDVPSEMILKKKFKKYKRLQFIIENGEDENFGVDSVIKSFTIGNYAKK